MGNNKRGMTKRVIRVISVVVLLSRMLIFVLPVQASSAFQKGMCYAAWQKYRYLSQYSDESLERLAQTGAEWVEIITTYYQDEYNSKRIFPTRKTPSDGSIAHVIKKAHSLGLKVMLKPHIDLIDTSDGLWRGDIGFQTEKDWQRWFAQYQKFIVHYAHLAEKTNVELFCIGTELCFASTKTEFWQYYIIPSVRTAYSGKLIYAANWDEYKSIGFWDDLDYIGIDAYFPLARKKNPGYEEIKTSWSKWADEIQEWHRYIGKPVILTEIGYRSSEYAATRPWEEGFGRKVDLELQALCYSAALSVFSNRDWCRGLYWWYWKSSPYAGGFNNRDFTPQGKPAEIVLNYWYASHAF